MIQIREQIGKLKEEAVTLRRENAELLVLVKKLTIRCSQLFQTLNGLCAAVGHPIEEPP